MPPPTSCRIHFCLGCIPLQMGTVIIGCLELVRSVLKIHQSIFKLVNYELSVEQCHREAKEHFKKPVDDDGPSPLESNLTKKCPSQNDVNIVLLVFGFEAVTFVTYFILTALMVHGAKRKKANFMAPWLGWQVAVIIFAILSVFRLGRFPSNDYASNFLNVFFLCYFFLVVSSYCQQLREEAASTTPMTVVAVTRPEAEMTVIIPSPRKDDPPPPYPGFSSVYNPVYDPTGSSDFPVVPPYTPYQANDISPPPYPGSSPPQIQSSFMQASSSVDTPDSPDSNLSAPSGPSSDNSEGADNCAGAADNSGETDSNGDTDNSGEAVPLVEKPTSPRN